MSESAIAFAGAARAVGAALCAPAFTIIPWNFRFAFAAAAGWAAAPLARGDPTAFQLSMPHLIGELAMGALIGLLAAISVEALRICGRVVGEQMGLSLAQTYDSASEGEANAAETLCIWSAITIFVAAGGIQTIATTAASSVQSIPLGSITQLDLPRAMPPLLDAAMLVGFKACLPVVAVLATATAVTALISRVVPGISVFSAGFGARAALGLSAAFATCAVMWASESAFVQQTLAGIAKGVAP